MTGAVSAGREALLAGRLIEAQQLLETALAEDAGDVSVRADLGWAYYRANDFVSAARHAAFVPGFEAAAAKLCSFGDERPYEMVGSARTSLPFLMLDPLPVVRLTVEGVGLCALIDTGAAELILDTDFAREIGMASYGAQEGSFAGGARASVEHGRVQRVGLGEIEVRRVPVVTLPVRRFSAITTPTPLLALYQIVPRPLKGAAARLPVMRHRIDAVIGTNFLAQFRATLDYPAKRLLLERDGGDASPEGVEIPFVTYEAHHMIVEDGWLNGAGPMRFFADSGLAGAAFTCPARTLERAGIAIPDVRHRGGMGGGGPVRTGRFTIDELRLGPLRQQHLRGTYIEPVTGEETPQEQRRDGIISHAFLRNYSWTIDARRSTFIFDDGRRSA